MYLCFSAPGGMWNRAFGVIWVALITASGGISAAVRSTTFSYGEHDVVVPIEPRSGVDALYAPRRALTRASRRA